MLEALIAIAILAVALGVLLSSTASSMRAQTRAQAVMQATLHAESRLAALGTTAPLRVGVSSGVLDGGWRWRAAVDPLPMPSAAPLLAVELAVLDERGAVLATLNTVRLAD